MRKIVFRPYAGDDPDEKIESDYIERALLAALPGEIAISNTIPDDATHVFGRQPGNWMRPSTLAYPAASNVHVDYWCWDGFLAHARRTVEVLDLAGASTRVAEIHAAGKDAFVKATRSKFHCSVVPRGVSLARHLDALIYSFIDCGPCLIVQERVDMIFEYRILVVGGRAVTGAGNIRTHTPVDNVAQFNPLVSLHPTNDDCIENPQLVERYLAFAAEVIPKMPVDSFCLDVAMIDGDVGIVEINPLMLGHIGLFGCDPVALTSAVLHSCGLLTA
ncbi:MAG: hypothetical protein DI537_32910 [Stutzerimonas stutzeri]|nr:MAG: hypothetical protein DI537_32910 [Stutzerimonas stutzeri]